MPELTLARRYFSAIEAGDVEALRDCYSSDASIWRNFDRTLQSRDDSLEEFRRLVAETTGRTFRDIQLRRRPGGFVQRHVLNYQDKSGRSVNMHALTIATVTKGRISRIEVYYDEMPPSQAGPPDST